MSWAAVSTTEGRQNSKMPRPIRELDCEIDSCDVGTTGDLI